MRKSAADMLGYDLTVKLTAAQSVRLDRAAALRLELDDLQGRQLAGLPIDTNKYVVASESLERLVGGDPEQSTTTHDFIGAREELENFFVQRAERIEACEAQGERKAARGERAAARGEHSVANAAESRASTAASKTTRQRRPDRPRRPRQRPRR
jgi:hypothetical protein